jgi:heme-degrading monooxygenase HmoA
MTSTIYRVDKFIVPAPAKEAFLAKVRATHALLRTLPGFKKDVLLEQISGPGYYNYVTLAEWSDMAAIEAAKTEVHQLHARMNFNPQEMFERLGIKADLGNYQSIDAA